MNGCLLSESLALLLKQRYDTDYLSERPAEVAERTGGRRRGDLRIVKRPPKRKGGVPKPLRGALHIKSQIAEHIKNFRAASIFVARRGGGLGLLNCPVLAPPPRLRESLGCFAKFSRSRSHPPGQEGRFTTYVQSHSEGGPDAKIWMSCLKF